MGPAKVWTSLIQKQDQSLETIKFLKAKLQVNCALLFIWVVHFNSIISIIQILLSLLKSKFDPGSQEVLSFF